MLSELFMKSASPDILLFFSARLYWRSIVRARVLPSMDIRYFKALAPLLSNISGQSFYCDWVNVGSRRTARTWHGTSLIIVQRPTELNWLSCLLLLSVLLTLQRDLWVSRGAVKYLPWPSKFRFPLPGLNTNDETIGINRHHLCYSLNLGQDMTLWQALLGVASLNYYGSPALSATDWNLIWNDNSNHTEIFSPGQEKRGLNTRVGVGGYIEKASVTGSLIHPFSLHFNSTTDATSTMGAVIYCPGGLSSLPICLRTFVTLRANRKLSHLDEWQITWIPTSTSYYS